MFVKMTTMTTPPASPAAAAAAAAASQQLAGTWATPDDWVKFRPIITRHYRDENMKLKELIAFMDKTYGFRATAKMYKDRLTKWRISKNVRASDITTIASKDDPGGGEFYRVGDRLIRADRLQQAVQRRATVARRALRNDSKARGASAGLGSPGWEAAAAAAAASAWELVAARGASSSPLLPHISTPDSIRIPESILLHSRGYVLGTLERAGAGAGGRGGTDLIRHEGPVHRWHMAFEETLANLSLVSGLDRVAFRSLDGAFELIRPGLADGDPQFVVVLVQIMALCLWFQKPDIMRMLVSYLHDLSRVVLGPAHPVTLICQDLRQAGVEASRDICRLAAEAAWHQFRGYLYPFRPDAFVRLTATYADILDSLRLHDEREAFLRYVVGSCDPGVVPVEQRLHLELHLVMCLRRQGRFAEALGRLARIRQDIMDAEPALMRDGEARCVELTYQALRTSGLCECDGGDAERGKAFFREAFELMQETNGPCSPRTTRALRDLARYSGHNEELMRDLEDRLTRSSLEAEAPVPGAGA